MTSKLNKLIQQHGFAIALLVLLTFTTFSYYINYWPHSAENLEALTIAAQSSPLEYFASSIPDYLPIYQPIPYLITWIQYQLVNIAPEIYFLSNIIFWFLCAFSLYWFLVKINTDKIIAIAISLLFLLDIRSADSLLIISERHILLSIVFFAVAMLCYFAALRSRNNLLFALFLLAILFAALSNVRSFALVTALLLFKIIAHQNNWKKLIFGSLLVLCIYLLMRFAVAEIPNDFCNDYIGYRNQTLNICYRDYSVADQMKFYGWNVWASFLATFFPTLFTEFGQWQGLVLSSNFLVPVGSGISPLELIFEFVAIPILIVALIKRPKVSIPILSIIIINSLLNYQLFRTSHLLISIIGYYGMLGIGFASSWKILNNLKIRKRTINFIAISMVVGLTFIISLRSAFLSHHLESTADYYSHYDPCMSLRFADHPESIGPKIIKDIKIYYGDPTPDCPSN